MNRRSIGYRIEAGPNRSQNPDLGSNAGESENSLSHLDRLRMGAVSLGASFNSPSDAELDQKNNEFDQKIGRVGSISSVGEMSTHDTDAEPEDGDADSAFDSVGPEDHDADSAFDATLPIPQGGSNELTPPDARHLNPDSEPTPYFGDHLKHGF